MTKDELINCGYSKVVVRLDGEQAFAHLWPKLLSSGPSIGWPFPADGVSREEVLVPLSDDDIDLMELRDGLIFSSIRLTSDELKLRYTRKDS